MPGNSPARERRDLVADDVLSAFNKVYDLSQTSRLKDTLRNALYVLIEQGKTLVDLLWLLSDSAFRARITSNIEDDIARLFRQIEFPSWNERYRTEALSAIQNGSIMPGHSRSLSSMTMRVDIPPDLEPLVREAMAKGRYRDERDLVTQLLRLALPARDGYEKLRSDVRRSLAQADRGEVKEADFAAIRKRLTDEFDTPQP